MQQQHSIISIKGLRKSFGKVDVIKDIDLEIEAGTIFCLLGSNGAGKTTMVKILSTLLRADAGEVLICGNDLKRKPDKVRQVISMTGQYAAVDELLTGRENMRLAGRLFHVDGVKERSDALLAGFDLAEAADRQAGTYSGGMRRKLDIAMSLMGEPKILFLDEPTTGLDPQNRLAMWREIKRLKEGGVTIFLTTQYLEEAEQLADRVVILNGGKVAASGSVAELKKLLPGGAVELVFDEAAYGKAAQLLADRQISLAPEARSITVMTNGSVDALTELLVLLKNEGIPIRSARQKDPTLEDVFLSQIGETLEVDKHAAGI